MENNNASSIIIEDYVKTFYVKSQVEYNSNPEYGLPKKGLNFGSGDILLIRNANDENWWSARKLEFQHNWKTDIKRILSGFNSSEGLVPSAERLARQHRNRDVAVEFTETATVIESNGSFTSNRIQSDAGGFATPVPGSGSLDLKKRRQMAYMQNLAGNKETIKSNADVKKLPTEIYTIVTPKPHALLRPVVVVGPGRNVVYNQLTRRYPELFSSPVNHTSRLRRTDERDGVDYHFVESRSQFEAAREAGQFLETVQFRQNWYGTSQLAVKTVADSRRHCLLDATVAILSELARAGLPPIAVLITADSRERATALMTEGLPGQTEVSDKVARSMMQNALLLNSRDRDHFNVVLNSPSPEELVDQVYNCIINCQKVGVWTPDSDQTALTNAKEP